MRFLRRFLTRLANFAAREDSDQRLREEIEEHLTLQTEENLRAGMPLVEARRQAALTFGARDTGYLRMLPAGTTHSSLSWLIPAARKRIRTGPRLGPIRLFKR
jgi:hypothetical protein